jgi:hypothetical protein
MAIFCVSDLLKKYAGRRLKKCGRNAYEISGTALFLLPFLQGKHE